MRPVVISSSLKSNTCSDILSRLFEFAPNDDGHAIKLSRAALIAQEISKKYEDREWLLIKGDDMWTRIHHLIADSVEAPGPTWVRTAGLEEAWVVSIPLFLTSSWTNADLLSRTCPRDRSCDASISGTRPRGH